MDMDNHFGSTKILTLPKNPPPPPPSQYFKSVQSNNSNINSAENSTENSNKNSKDNSTKISSKYLPMNSTKNSTENANKNSNENSTNISSKYLPMNSTKHSTEKFTKNSNANSNKISSKYLPMNSIKKRVATPTNISTENSTKNSAKNSSKNSTENSKQEDMIYHGEVIHDRYKIDKQIGSGIYGQVFKAFDQKEQIDVAIKIIRKGEQFQRQAKTEIHLLELIRNTRDSNRTSCKQSAIFFKSCICIPY